MVQRKEKIKTISVIPRHPRYGLLRWRVSHLNSIRRQGPSGSCSRSIVEHDLSDKRVKKVSLHEVQATPSSYDLGQTENISRHSRESPLWVNVCLSLPSRRSLYIFIDLLINWCPLSGNISSIRYLEPRLFTTVKKQKHHYDCKLGIVMPLLRFEWK